MSNEEYNNGPIETGNGNSKWRNGRRSDTKRVNLWTGEASEDSAGDEPKDDSGLREQLGHGKLGAIRVTIHGPQKELFDGESRELIEDGGKDDADLAWGR